MRRIVASGLIVTLLSATCGPAAYAQEIGDVGAPEQEEAREAPVIGENASTMTCHAKGKHDARHKSAAGSTVGGLCGGVLLGLIGTGIAVVAQTKTDPSAELLLQVEDQSDDCQYAYIEAFRDEYHSKKKSAALTGGLIGTVVIVGVFLATQGN